MGREIKPVTAHRSTMCQAVTGYGHSYQVPWLQRCQQDGSHIVDGGVRLCGIHYNAGFRKELNVVRPLRMLDEGDL